jgi:hypothetical protein
LNAYPYSSLVLLASQGKICNLFGKFFPNKLLINLNILLAILIKTGTILYTVYLLDRLSQIFFILLEVYFTEIYFLWAHVGLDLLYFRSIVSFFGHLIQCSKWFFIIVTVGLPQNRLFLKVPIQIRASRKIEGDVHRGFEDCLSLQINNIEISLIF